MSKLLFTPVPTNVPEDICEKLGQDLIHHRMGYYHTFLDEQYDMTVSNGMGVYSNQLLRVGIIGEIKK